jgi:integrase
MRKKLTQTIVDKLKPRPGVSYDVRDTVQPGLVVRVWASGKASYVVRLTDAATKRRYWWTLGLVADLTLDEARGLASGARGQTALAKLGAAVDPREARQQQDAEAKRAMTLDTFLEDHYREYAETHHKSKARGAETIARIHSRFPDLRQMPLREITPFAAERWRTKRLKDGASRATVNRDVTALKVALAYAVKQHLLDVHPLTIAADFRPLKGVDRFGGKTRILSDEEEVALRTALATRDDTRRQARDHHNVWLRERGYPERPVYGTYSDNLTPLTLTALSTGCRFGELAELRWSDLDVKRKLLTVRSETAKTSTGRTIPLNSEIVTVLKAWQPRDVDADAYVFPGRDGGRLVDIKTAWKEIVKAAKLKAFRFHDCRHAFASRLVAAGADINLVRELLGHTTVLMTSRYLHTSPKAKAEAVEKLARAAGQ